jgi:branched-subunit amino acid ABC-type transport system permease component
LKSWTKRWKKRSALAGLMGVFHGPFINISLEMGHHYIMNAFAVVVIGGLGNITGTYISALILGQLEAFGILYFPFFERIFMYGFMMVVLILFFFAGEVIHR